MNKVLLRSIVSGELIELENKFIYPLINNKETPNGTIALEDVTYAILRIKTHDLTHENELYMLMEFKNKSNKFIELINKESERRQEEKSWDSFVTIDYLKWIIEYIEEEIKTISFQKDQTEKSINEKPQNQQFNGENKGIENEYLEIYFKKLFDIDLDFDKENERITFNGNEYKDGNELKFHVKKHLVDITHLFLKEINRNILITKDKETKNDYLLSIQKKNKWHQSNVKKLISKVESEGLHTFSNTNFCKITSAGKLLKMGEFLGSEFQTLNELIIITYDTAETFNEELNNFITPDQNTNLYTKKENLIKWNSSPSHFGFIISELINKGYFENLPMYQGEVNYSEIARLFSSIVDFNTSEQNLLKSFNPNNEKISETVKNKFAIPNCEDIKPANSPNKVTIKKNTKPPIKTK